MVRNSTSVVFWISDLCWSRGVEEYASGYPRFTALLSTSNSFLICRRFSRLRARLLLLKQDRLSKLETRLDQIDQTETSLLFLGSIRRDRNVDRASVVAEIDSYLHDYDEFVVRSSQMLKLDFASSRDVTSLTNWLDGNGCVAREEAAYLYSSGDLASLASPSDNAIAQLENWVEDRVARCYKKFKFLRHHNLSVDPYVFIYTGPWIKRFARAVLLSFIILLLLPPIILCNLVQLFLSRIIIVAVSTSIYLVTVSALTKSRAIDLILAAVTYTTVLIVFVSNTNTTKA